MLRQNTRESAVRREDFHGALQEWLDDSLDNRVGEGDSYAGPAWVWVRHGGAHYYLSATSTRAGIREYVRHVAASGGDPEWSACGPEASVAGDRRRIAVGRDRQIIDGFEFYQHLPGR